MAFKKRPQSVANLAREAGLNIPPLPGSSGSKLESPLTNPIAMRNPDKSIYMELWQNYDMQQCCARYVWKNLPNGLWGWQIERMLYYRGSVAGFMVGDKFYVLPYVVQGNINLYGMPVKIRPVAYNGKPLEKVKTAEYEAKDDQAAFYNEDTNEAFSLPVDLMGDERDKYSAVILYDSVPTFVGGGAPAMYNRSRLIINEMADVLARININIVVSNKKILLHIKDAKQASIVQKELSIAFGSDCPFGVLTSEFDVNSVQSSSDYNSDDLFNALKNYDAIRCFMAGINSRGFGTEKQERLITGELNGDLERVELVSDQGLELRKIWADLCNKKFGTNIQVELRVDRFKEEEDGNGKTPEEEMQEANAGGGSDE